MQFCCQATLDSSKNLKHSFLMIFVDCNCGFKVYPVYINPHMENPVGVCNHKNQWFRFLSLRMICQHSVNVYSLGDKHGKGSMPL